MMNSLPEDEYFPRGGKTNFNHKKGSRKRELIDKDIITDETVYIAGKKKPNKKLISWHTTEQNEVIKPWNSLKVYSIQNNMIILGRVKKISKFSLQVELPDFYFANVNITEISEKFTNKISQKLEDPQNKSDNILLEKMFVPGEFLPVKVINITKNESKMNINIDGSINPSEIYSEMKHTNFQLGSLLWGSISSKLDHGYEMSVGIKNCRVFLPFNNTPNDFNYVIGKPMWAVIHRIDIDKMLSILKVSVKPEHVNNAQVVTENMHCLIPGIKVKFTVEKLQQHGLKGSILDNITGYVDENYLHDSTNQLSKYRVAQTIIAQLLYVEPITKIAHLSFAFATNTVEQDDYHENIGEVWEGVVINHWHNGIFLQFPNNNNAKGFIANKRLLKTLKKTNDTNINDAIKMKYEAGSKHYCRIMDYNYFLNTFICTTEKEIVNEKLFSINDVTAGQLFNDLEIVSIKDDHFIVSIGRLTGIIKKIDISDSKYSENIRKQYKEHQIVKGRVLTVDPINKKISFTIKPSMVNNENCLTNIEQWKKHVKYPGVVIRINMHGTIVRFYNNIKGWIPAGDENPLEYFFLGQVIQAYVKKVRKNMSLLLSFTHPYEHRLIIGDNWHGKVVEIHEDGIFIRLQNSDKIGFIPNSFISCGQSFCISVKNTFNVGQYIMNLMYMGVQDTKLLFSRKECLQNKKLPKLQFLRNGDLVQCSFISKCDKGIVVLPFISDYHSSALQLQSTENPSASGTMIIIDEHIPANIDPESLLPYQILTTKLVYNKEENVYDLSLNFKLTHSVLKTTAEDVKKKFSFILNELAYLESFGKMNNWKCSKYNRGRKLICEIIKIGTVGGCVVLLPNGCKGIAVPDLCPRYITQESVGRKIKGIVIGHNYEKQYVDVCLKSTILNNISKHQSGLLPSTVKYSAAKKLLEKDDYIIALLTSKQMKQQLIYLPTEVNNINCSRYYKDKKLKVAICGEFQKYLMGLPKRLYFKMNKDSIK